MILDLERDLFLQLEDMTRDDLIVLSVHCLAEVRDRLGPGPFEQYLDSMKVSSRWTELCTQGAEHYVKTASAKRVPA